MTLAGAPRVVALVQARMGSSRLPGKVLELAGGKTLLEQLVVRLRRVRALSDVCIATTDRPGDDAVVGEARRLGVASFRGSEADVLARFHGAAVATGAEVVVRVTADCPLLDPDEVQRVVAAFLEAWPTLDYAANQEVGRRRVPHGEVVEIFSRAALERAFHRAREPHHREHVTPYFYEEPGRFRTAALHPAFTDDLSTLRLTVDTPQDLALVRAVFDALGDAPGATGMLAVARFLAAHPVVASGNAQVVQRSFREASDAAQRLVFEPGGPTAPRLLVLRADAGAAAGGGHVSRALALGQAWRDAGGAVILVTSSLPRRARAAAVAAGFGVAELPPATEPGSGDDARCVAALVAARGAHAIVVDGYGFAPEYLAAVRGPTHVTAYVEDHDAEPPADVLIRPRPASASGSSRQPASSRRPVVLEGAEHVVVRAEIARAPRPPRTFAPPLRVLLTFGAADPAGLWAPALAAARAVGKRAPLSITLLVGDLADGVPPAEGVRVLCGVDDMAGLFGETDLAVAAAGVTAWELLCSGVPALVTWVADNQRPVAEAVAAAGAGWNLGPASALDAAAIERELERVVAAGPAALRAASGAGAAFVDGRGAERIAGALERVYEEQP